MLNSPKKLYKSAKLTHKTVLEMQQPTNELPLLPKPFNKPNSTQSKNYENNRAPEPFQQIAVEIDEKRGKWSKKPVVIDVLKTSALHNFAIFIAHSSFYTTITL